MRMLYIILMGAILMAGRLFAGQHEYTQSRLNYDQLAVYDRLVNHSVFATIFNRYVKFGEKYGWNHEQRYNSVATAIGYAYSRNCWQVGASFSLEHGKRKYDTLALAFPFYKAYIHRSTNTVGLTLFGNYVLPSGWYGHASAFAGYQHTNNNLIKYRYSGSPGVFYPDGNRFNDGSGHFALALEAGRRFALTDSFGLTPHIGINYAVHTAEYMASESSRSALTDNKPRHSLEIPIGVAIKNEISCGAWIFKPFVDASLIARLGGSNFDFRPGFASFNGHEWNVYGLDRTGMGGRVKVGTEIRYSERVNLSIDYAFETRRKYRDHRVSAAFGLAF